MDGSPGVCPSEETGGGIRWGLLVCAVVAAATAMRICGVASWPIRGDEPFTIRDSLRLIETGWMPKYPAYYFIVGVLFRITGSTSIFIARLPSLVIALATFPLFYYFGKRAFGRRIALIAIAALAVTEWHVVHSKSARFYSGAFLFAGLSGLLLYSAVQERRPWRAFAALILGGVAALFHPTGAFVVAGGVCYFLVLWLFRGLRPPHRIGRVAAFYLLPVAVAAVPGIYVAVRILLGWSKKGLQWNYTPVHVALGVVRSVGLVTALAAFGGALVCLPKRRQLGVFFMCWLVPAGVFLVLLSPFVDVRPDYLFASMPACFFLAAALCVVPFEDRQPGVFRTLCVAAFAVVIVLSQMPPMLSHFTEKGADDPRVVASFLRERLVPGDKVVGYVSGLSQKLLGQKTYQMGQLYSSQTEWDDGLAKVEAASHRTWFALSLPRAGMPWELGDWLCANAQLVRRWRAKRFDYLSRDIEVWLYDPRWPKRPVEKPKAAPAPRDG